MIKINLFVVFSVCLCFENSQPQVRLNENRDSSTLFDFAGQIFINHFPSARKLVFLYPSQYEDATGIIQKIKIPITINAMETPLHQALDVREPSDVIFFLEHSTNIPTYLNNTLWTGSTHFFVAFKESNSTGKTLRRVFEMFKAANVVNVFALVATSHDVLIYSYTMYNYQDCDSVKLILLGTQFNKFFPQNRLANYNGCVIRATVVDLPPMTIFPKSRVNGSQDFHGIELNIIVEVSKKKNFTPWFDLARDGETWGWLHPSPRGAIGEVYFRQSHYAFGRIVSTLSRYRTLDMTVPVSPYQECITSVVPVGAAKTQATWIEIYVYEFSWFSWCCILICFALSSFTFWAISKALETSSFGTTTLYMFSSFINVSVKAPKNSSLRILFLGWILYSFIVVVSYQTLMGSKLTVSYRLQEIDTIRDLLDSDLNITGVYNVIKLFNYDLEDDLKKLLSRLHRSPYKISEILELIAIGKPFAYMREGTTLKYYAQQNPQVRGKVHFVKQCVYQYYPIMLLQRRSLLTNITNHIITQLFESGILLKWNKQYLTEAHKPRPTGIRLTLRHMTAPFAALMFGLVLSALSFVTENVYYRLEKRFRRHFRPRAK